MFIHPDSPADMSEDEPMVSRSVKKVLRNGTTVRMTFTCIVFVRQVFLL